MIVFEQGLSLAMDLCFIGMCYANRWQAAQRQRSGTFWVVAGAAAAGFTTFDALGLFQMVT